jgi:hypothetical protein
MNDLTVAGAADGAKRRLTLKQNGLFTLQCHFSGNRQTYNACANYNAIQPLHSAFPKSI